MNYDKDDYCNEPTVSKEPQPGFAFSLDQSYSCQTGHGRFNLSYTVSISTLAYVVSLDTNKVMVFTTKPGIGGWMNSKYEYNGQF